MIVRRPTPFGELMTLRHELDRLFDEDFFRPLWTATPREGLIFALDVRTTPEALLVEAALPGVRPEDVDITVENGTLTISGKSAEEHEIEEGSHLVKEIRRGSFSRSITLPDGLRPDDARATFEDGMLKLEIPKAEEVKPRQIRISPVTQASGTAAIGEPAGKR